MTVKNSINGITSSEQIYATGASVDGKSIVHATVYKQDYLPLEITSRVGDKIFVSYDAVEALILALQAVQKQIQTGVLKA